MTLQDYINLLRSHDWSHEYSDDQAVWRKGTRERAALRQAQAWHDPHFDLWNIHAPPDYRQP